MIVRLRQTGQMDVSERTAALAAEGQRLLAVSSDLDVRVPTCPGWSARNLVGHIGSAWQAFAYLMESGSTEPPDFSAITGPPEDDAELPEFARTNLDRIVAAAAAADPDQPVWTWSGPRTMGFYQRRAHLETVVHRVDAEIAAGDRSPVDGAVGIDGIDELFTVVVSAPAEPPSGSLHLHQTDGDGELMLQIIDGAITVSHEHAKGDAALRASGEDLFLTMWGRRSLDGLELFGSAAVAAEWIALSP